jgi:transglutaminase-like putative cysteine protease
MSWRLEINHLTRYRYDRPVVASYNEARLTPPSTAQQFVIEAQVAVRPAAQLFCFTDYWGALVHAFDVHSPHQSLLVTSRAIVETQSSGGPASGGPGTGPSAGPASRDGTGPATGRAGPSSGNWGEADVSGPEGALSRPAGPASWDDLAGTPVADRFYELLTPSRFVTPEDLAEVARGLRAGHAAPADAVPSVLDWVHGQLEYGSGATNVHTSAVEAWHAGRGVCQDFAHLSLAVLRAMGIPARYVSGYFYPEAAGAIGAKVLGESHAWVEAWTGAWGAHDPTNLMRVGERHVMVARGRDYADVAPVRGIYSGPPGSSTEVTVELVRRA